MKLAPQQSRWGCATGASLRELHGGAWAPYYTPYPPCAACSTTSRATCRPSLHQPQRPDVLVQPGGEGLKPETEQRARQGRGKRGAERTGSRRRRYLPQPRSSVGCESASRQLSGYGVCSCAVVQHRRCQTHRHSYAPMCHLA